MSNDDIRKRVETLEKRREEMAVYSKPFSFLFPPLFRYNREALYLDKEIEELKRML